MLKSSVHLQPTRLSEAAINASRQVWLASLGAAVVTRDWVQTEAGDMFKSLVKEGTVVESQAVRFVGHRLETSFSAANSVWKETRRTVESTVKQAADAAVSFRTRPGTFKAQGEETGAQGGSEDTEKGEAGGQGRQENPAHRSGRDEARVIR